VLETVPGHLVLLDDEQREPVGAPWAGPLLALGARLARQPAPGPDSRLIVAVTLPTRDLAAVLIATGWVLTRPVAAPATIEQVLPSLEPNTPVRMITGDELVADCFFGYEVREGRGRVHIGRSSWLMDKVDILVPAPGLDASRFGRENLSHPGGLVTMADRVASWRAAQAASAADVVFVGTKAALISEMPVRVGRDGSLSGANSFGELLRPDDGVRPAWGSVVLSASRFDEAVVPPGAGLAVLDGASAIGWLRDTTTGMAIAVIDRSVTDEFAAESVIQLRSMGGVPVPLDSLGWRPPAGVEALAFEARR
jgi:hypothetical protein